MAPEHFSFSRALELLRKGNVEKVTRVAFRDTCYIMLQTPDEHSKMTKPYLYMVKKSIDDRDGVILDRFPIDLSCESLLADDWYVVEN